MGLHGLLRDTPPSTKFGTKFLKQVAVDQLVYFAYGLKAKEFVLFLLIIDCV
jgi:hypothetical protein